MKIFKPIKDRIVLRRQKEQVLFAAALSELQSGYIRQGLMAKAISNALGDERKAKALYIEMLAKTMSDEQYVEQRSREEIERNKQQEMEKEMERRLRSIAANKRAQETQSTTGLGKLFLRILGILILFYFLLVLFESLSSTPEEVVTESDIKMENYNNMVAQYEKAYPQIDPDSSVYDSGLADKINARVRSLEGAGNSSFNSLRLAMDEFLKDSGGNAARASQPAPKIKNARPARQCVLKGIMTDDDYYACGMNPPSRP